VSAGQAGSGGTGRAAAFGPPTALQAGWAVLLWLGHLHYFMFPFFNFPAVLIFNHRF
jgi:hypothetical protein